MKLTVTLIVEGDPAFVAWLTAREMRKMAEEQPDDPSKKEG